MAQIVHADAPEAIRGIRPKSLAIFLRCAHPSAAPARGELPELHGVRWATEHPIEDQRLSVAEALRAYSLDACQVSLTAGLRGSLEVGKDGDVALYDGDPFEYTSHCIGVIVGGKIVSEEPR